MSESRAAAARALAAVLDGRSLDNQFTTDNWLQLDVRERALARELATGSVRHYYSLAADTGRFLREPLHKRDKLVWALLLVGAYQLRHTRVPDHAAVSATVAAARRLGKRWAAGLLNAVLRQLLRSPAPPAHDNHPDWLRRRLRQDHPESWQQLLRTNDSRAPMSLRINCRRTTRDACAELLSECSLTTKPSDLADTALVLDDAQPLQQLPHARCGLFSVQDEGAQLAAPLLLESLVTANRPVRILDACAAPGGKAMHLMELMPAADLTLLDTNPERLEQTRRRLADRPGRYRLVSGDAARSDSWWDGKRFDAILADVPCSGTGSIRRNPDIRLLRRPGDIAPMAARQLAILQGLWPLLEPGGLLLYCTCSLLAEENQDVIDTFLNTCPAARADQLAVPWGQVRGAGRELLPRIGGNDGFYFARLRHAADARVGTS